MDEEIKLSIVVSCYKQENYIEECLNSIFSQQTSFRYEVIISDDFSPDTTREIIMKFYAQYPDKIIILFQSKNVGAARNYLAAHKLARGIYVAHFDGDDIMLPGKLQTQVDMLEANPNCNVVFHRARYFSDDRSYTAETGCINPHLDCAIITPEQLMCWGTIAVHSSYIYRRSTRKMYDYKRDFMEWFLAVESLLADGVAIYINKILVEYRCNPIGNTYLSSKSGRERAYLILMKDVLFYYKALPQFRTDLYAHQVINIIMYVKNIHKIKFSMLNFLLSNIFYIRPKKIFKAFTIRMAVGPSKKIR